MKGLKLLVFKCSAAAIGAGHACERPSMSNPQGIVSGAGTCLDPSATGDDPGNAEQWRLQPATLIAKGSQKMLSGAASRSPCASVSYTLGVVGQLRRTAFPPTPRRVVSDAQRPLEVGVSGQAASRRHLAGCDLRHGRLGVRELEQHVGLCRPLRVSADASVRRVLQPFHAFQPTMPPAVSTACARRTSAPSIFAARVSFMSDF